MEKKPQYSTFVYEGKGSDTEVFHRFKKKAESEFEDRHEDLEARQYETIRRIAEEGLNG